jgi:hypothetical protein
MSPRRNVVAVARVLGALALSLPKALDLLAYPSLTGARILNTSLTLA